MNDITNNEMYFVLNIFKNPEKEYNANNMAQQLGISSMGALKIAKRLEKENILKSKQIGKARIYKINMKNDYAKEYLSKKNFNASLIDIIYHACRSHRCKDALPQSIEAKIIATADALSHFHNGFYLRILYSKSRRGKDFQKIR